MELRSVGVNISDEDILYRLFEGLPQVGPNSYRSEITVLQNNCKYNFQETVAYLQTKWRLSHPLKRTKQLTGRHANAATVETRTCHECNVKGHIRPHCPQLAQSSGKPKATAKRTGAITCWVCNEDHFQSTKCPVVAKARLLLKQGEPPVTSTTTAANITVRKTKPDVEPVAALKEVGR